MKSQKLITAVMLMLPGLSWGEICSPGYTTNGGMTCVHIPAPEPGILPLLAAGGIIMVAVKFMRRKK